MQPKAEAPELVVIVSELKRSCAQLLDHVEALGISEVDLGDDYYWFAEKSEVYDVTRPPARLSIGQLSEDLGDIRDALNGKAPPVALLLVRLASVLRKVGESTVG